MSGDRKSVASLLSVKDFNDDLIRGIVEVNNDSPVRQGRRFPHYGKTFDQVKKDHSSFLDRSDFICAYLGNEFIGFLKIVYRRRDCFDPAIACQSEPLRRKTCQCPDCKGG